MRASRNQGSTWARLPHIEDTDGVHRHPLSVGSISDVADVDNFQETPENGSILVLEGRLVTPSSFPSPEFLLGTRTNLNRVAMSHDTQWVTPHTRTLGQGLPPTPKAGSRIKEYREREALIPPQSLL